MDGWVAGAGWVLPGLVGAGFPGAHYAEVPDLPVREGRLVDYRPGPSRRRPDVSQLLAACPTPGRPAGLLIGRAGSMPAFRASFGEMPSKGRALTRVDLVGISPAVDRPCAMKVSNVTDPPSSPSKENPVFIAPLQLPGRVEAWNVLPCEMWRQR